MEPCYEPPSVSELQEFFLADRKPTGHLNQVWPNVYIGNEVAARDKATLHSLGITHIVNAAHRPPQKGPEPCFYVNTGSYFYKDMSVDYYGVEADDAVDFILSPFFYPVARYIRAALAMEGHVFVHCLMGESQSATLVLAFLMISEGLKLQEAAAAVRQHRDICPNPGFLLQLHRLDASLERERRRIQAEKLSRTDSTHQEETPPLLQLRRIMWTDRKPLGTVNQVWPNLYLGNDDMPVPVKYIGVEAADHPLFDLRPFFSSTAEFIDNALKHNGKVFVHCAMGVSRSGAMVLAYLMICQHVSLVDAIMAVRLNRDIGPNAGFLLQLRQLELNLTQQRRLERTENQT
ncbi:dual specificity protein phosphatase 13-like isoform X2 [Hypomesus transpacificus]|uniref:dual specificity protein phosphatase 13-like isoform X2 n=1 Tax=Hypomesus transpacificus TaxID=137520 RepID=UPI001F07EE16|nr:dual specificity protein phosphatase 13-like isoform X2 [Hypomesus transpacificus]